MAQSDDDAVSTPSKADQGTAVGKGTNFIIRLPVAAAATEKLGGKTQQGVV